MVSPFNQPSIVNCDYTKRKIEAGRVRYIDKDQMWYIVKMFLLMGTKADIIIFKPLKNCSLEIKLSVFNRLAVKGLGQRRKANETGGE